MATTSGSGYSKQTDSHEAGAEATRAAISSLHTDPQLLLVFFGDKYNQESVLAGVKSIAPHALIAGGAAMGVFNNENLSYEGYECAVLALCSDELQFQTHCVNNIHLNEAEAGEKMGRWIFDQKQPDKKALLVFYETAKSAEPPMLNFATPFFQSMEKYLDANVECAGSGLLSNMQLTNGFQIYNDSIIHQSAVAVLISGDCKMYSTVMHGCKPGSSYHTITKCEGPVIYEINNKPALEAIQELLGPNSGLDWKSFPLFVTLGVNKGDKFGPFREQDYANRLCLAVLEEQKALVMFEPDLKPGDEVQLMHRSVTLDYLRDGYRDLQQQIGSDKVQFYFYINCAGRAMPYTGGNLEDAEELRNIIGKNTPFMGFYSGVEVAKMGHRLQALDWTGVLCALVTK
jgi:hypothetical protein